MWWTCVSTVRVSGNGAQLHSQKLSCAGVGKPFFTFGTEPPACQLQCWSLEPYLKQWLLQEEATRNMPAKGATGAFLGSLVNSRPGRLTLACV